MQPRNPAYDWRIWARSRFARPGDTHRPGAHKFADQHAVAQHEEKLALLMQTDAHMRLAASRQVLVRVAKLVRSTLIRLPFAYALSDTKILISFADSHNRHSPNPHMGSGRDSDSLMWPYTNLDEQRGL